MTGHGKPRQRLCSRIPFVNFQQRCSQFYMMAYFIGINARAPPEPYYGRTIGQFTDFAHGIRVKMMSCVCEESK